MTIAETTRFADNDLAGSQRRALEDWLYQLAVALTIVALVIGAIMAANHQPDSLDAGQAAHDRPAMVEDWHGNSASIRPAE